MLFDAGKSNPRLAFRTTGNAMPYIHATAAAAAAAAVS